MDIDDGARPGPVRVERWRCELQRPMHVLLGWVGSVRLEVLVWKIGCLGLLDAGLLDVWFAVGDAGLVVFGGFLGRIGGFGGSVPLVVLMHAEQLQGVGGLGEDADGFGAAYL